MGGYHARSTAGVPRSEGASRFEGVIKMSGSFNRAMLQVARTARGFTQGELATRSGVTQAAISKLEHGLTQEPTDDVISAIARAVRFPLAIFFCDDGKQWLFNRDNLAPQIPPKIWRATTVMLS